MKETIQTPSTDSKFILAVRGVPAVEASYMGSRFLITYSKGAKLTPWRFQDQIDTIDQKSFGGLKTALGQLGMSLKLAGVGNGARSLELTVSEAAMAKYGTEGVSPFVSQERIAEINADINAATVLNDPPAETVAEPVAEIAPGEAVAEVEPVKKAKKAKKAAKKETVAEPVAEIAPGEAVAEVEPVKKAKKAKKAAKKAKKA